MTLIEAPSFKIYRVSLIHERIISAPGMSEAQAIFEKLIERDLRLTKDSLNHYDMRIKVEYKGE